MLTESLNVIRKSILNICSRSSVLTIVIPLYCHNHLLSAHTAFCHLPVLLVPACILLPRNIEKGCLATSLSINVRGGSPCHILQYESRSVLFLHLYSGNLNIDIRNLKPRHILNRIFHLFLNFFRNFHNTVIIFQV